MEENASGRYLRALQNHNENLGGFSQVLDCDAPGWIVRVTSKHGDVYYLAIIGTRLLDYFTVAILYKSPPWKYWIGDTSENPLYRGDNSEKYKLLRDEANKINTK